VRCRVCHTLCEFKNPELDSHEIRRHVWAWKLKS
jgi:hypothetical protein